MKSAKLVVAVLTMVCSLACAVARATTQTAKPVVHVKAAPLVVVWPPNLTVAQGDSFTFGLAVTGGVPPYTCTLDPTTAPSWASIAYLPGYGCVITGTVPSTQTIGDTTFTVTVADSAP